MKSKTHPTPAFIVLALMLAGPGLAFAQTETPPAAIQPPAAPQSEMSPATPALDQAPAVNPYANVDHPYFNNANPSLAGQVVPSPQDAAAHNPAVLARDKLPILAHTFNFTDDQRKLIKDALSSQPATTGSGPSSAAESGASLIAGTEISGSLELRPVPDSIVAQMPWVKPYKYAAIGDRIVIVDPHLPVVVAVLK